MLSSEIQKNAAGSSLIRQMFEQATELKNKHGADKVYDFSLGNPILEPPDQLIRALLAELSSPGTGRHMYMNNSGVMSLREHIAKQLTGLTNQPFTAANIVISCGAAGGLNILFKSILNKGDEVIVIAPYFPEYSFYVGNYGGVMVPANSDETFMPDLIDIEKKITDRTKAIIINTPNNPSGAVYSAPIMEKLAALLNKISTRRKDPILLINDEPYRNMIYSGEKPIYIGDYYDHSISVYSYSKELGIPGERLGYVAISPACKHKEELSGLLNFCNRIMGFVNAPAIFQHVIPKLNDVNVDFSFYKKNRDVFYDILTAAGFQFIKPEGAFYFFVPTPEQDDLHFCNQALKHNILIVPGRAFGSPGYCRIAYCVASQIIKNSANAFKNLMKQY